MEESFIRIRLRDPGLFEDSLWTATIKQNKPRVKAIMGRLKGTQKTETQALLFPKEDSWSVVDAQKWARETFLDKKDKELEYEEVKGDKLPAPAAGDADLYEQLSGIVLKDAGGVRHKPFGQVQVKIADRESHELDIIISSDIVDRDKELVVPAGLTMGEAARVPLVAGHGHGDLRKHIGAVTKATPSGRLVTAKAKYLSGKGNPEADWAWVLANEGLGAYSIGFIPIEFEDADLTNEKVAKAVRAGEMPIRKYTKWELVEVSQVIVPSNKMALQRLRDNGIVAQEQYDLVAKGLRDEPLAEEAERDLMRLIAEFKAVREANDVLSLFDGKGEKSMANPEDIKLSDDESKKVLEDALAAKKAEIEKAKKDHEDDEDPEMDDEDLDDEEREEALAAAREAKKKKKKEKAASVEKTNVPPAQAPAQAPIEKLAEGHVKSISTALTSIGQGADVLKIMIANAAGPAAGSQAPPAPAQAAQAAAPAAKETSELEVKGEVTIDAKVLVEALNAWRIGFIKDVTELFESQLKEAQLVLPPNSAAFVTVEDLIDAVMIGAKGLIDGAVSKAVADPKSFHKKG